MEDSEQLEEAMLLNQKLKAMLAAQAQGDHTGGSRRRAASQPLRLGGPTRDPRRPTLDDPRLALQDEARLGMRQVGARTQESRYSQRSMANSRAPVMESSHAINRRKAEERIAQENMGIAARIVGCSGSATTRGASRPKGQDPKLPSGWTRGIGGRLLPPPKQRWGAKPSYDAGDWNS